MLPPWASRASGGGRKADRSQRLRFAPGAPARCARLGADARRPPTARPRPNAPRRRVVSMSPTRVVSRRPARVKTKRSRSARHRAGYGSRGSSVNRLQGRRTRSSTCPASRGPTSPTTRCKTATAAVAWRYRSSAIPRSTAPISAIRPETARLASRWLAYRRTVRRTFRAAGRGDPGRLRRVVVGDEPVDRAGECSRVGRCAHHCDGAAPEPGLDPRVFGTRLLPPGHRFGRAVPSWSALVPAQPSVALRGPGALAVVARDDGANVREKEGEEIGERGRVSGRAPPLRLAPGHAVDDRPTSRRSSRVRRVPWDVHSAVERPRVRASPRLVPSLWCVLRCRPATRSPPPVRRRSPPAVDVVHRPGRDRLAPARGRAFARYIARRRGRLASSPPGTGDRRTGTSVLPHPDPVDVVLCPLLASSHAVRVVHLGRGYSIASVRASSTARAQTMTGFARKCASPTCTVHGRSGWSRPARASSTSSRTTFAYAARCPFGRSARRNPARRSTLSGWQVSVGDSKEFRASPRMRPRNSPTTSFAVVVRVAYACCRAGALSVRPRPGRYPVPVATA